MSDLVIAADPIAILKQEVREIYLSDQRPWVIGYSGGKDSTATLQLIWLALADMAPEERAKPIYVISSDTLVETPVITNYIKRSLKKIGEEAQRLGLPISTHKVTPTTKNSFWVNLIGRGYPAPSRRFRWCTERLKIEPANDFIKSRVAEFGEVVMVLGVRSQESATRAQVMSLHKIKGSKLSRHSSLLNAFVYAPIKDFSTDNVWDSPAAGRMSMGNDNRDLVAMYRNAQAGECPLVVDKTTPSAAIRASAVGSAQWSSGPRHGSDDRVRRRLARTAARFRDMLAETQDPTRKREFRDFRRKNGSVSFIGETDRPMPGPYLLAFCKTLLRRLLEVQVRIQREAPFGEAPLLILDSELHEIRRLWRSERGDWEDSVPAIVRDVLGRDLDWVIEDAAAFTTEDSALLDEVCRAQDVPTDLVVKLIDIERAAHGLKRRHAVHTRIEDALRQEWRGCRHADRGASAGCSGSRR
jgi:DNA sulfur modification protein DndC